MNKHPITVYHSATAGPWAGWYWHYGSSSGDGPFYGPFKIEALARKDASQRTGPLV
jgi:hypothetical protein